MKHIHPVFDQILGREDKERMLKQRGCVLWFTGLSGSGKTTIARHVEQELAGKGVLTQVLDGDNIRTGINNNLGFGEEDRVENIRRIAEVTKLFVHCGIVTLNCFISPTREMRQMAKDIVGADDFVEVFVDTSLYECEARDVKGLYKKARAGEIPNFTGIHEPFESPLDPDVHIVTEQQCVSECVSSVISFVIPRIF
ncbi:Adenylyl-sulfate kinase [Prosthecochloris aestuarii DSM 271]|uniref:Adenylyl-sulfate kinase n=1 Tax=Prosthecochloris aestuarii (strain DSM 271 / SK 413) TaxID=290512 RepID=B4S3M5_PROA2|nr:adenylyl-sulfate kinase [Prosthecochloris aestuarii]ACF46764.1 Adenylyl-sulfate kinase [Prosthecochloris aestuarii DSM 271]